MIATRDQLANTLTVAAELEHGLMLQYLFAAYSLKKSPTEGVTPEQADQCRSWERVILRIARDEMVHLGTVCNLLAAIGEAPHFLRPNFPQRAGPSSPFVFELTPFSDKTLYRFVRAESPAKKTPRAVPPPNEPDAILFQYTGELYRDIEQGFADLSDDLGESRLFIGPPSAQDTAWSNSMQIPVIRKKIDAVTAIKAIITQGEGSPGDDEGSHFDLFDDMRIELAAAIQANPKFEPARRVVSNPRVDERLFGARGGTLITQTTASGVAHLFDGVYHTLLLMLMQYYSFSGESQQQMDTLRDSARALMSMAIRPIAEILTVLPVADGSCRTAGPGFEIVTEPRLSTQLPNRWTVLAERFADHVATAGALSQAKGLPAVARLTFIAQSLGGIAANLRGVAP